MQKDLTNKNKVVSLLSLSTSKIYVADTETKIQERQTGASPAVIFRQRLGVDSSDLSLFVSPNSSTMLSTNDAPTRSKSSRAVSAQRIQILEQTVEYLTQELVRAYRLIGQTTKPKEL